MAGRDGSSRWVFGRGGARRVGPQALHCEKRPQEEPGGWGRGGAEAGVELPFDGGGGGGATCKVEVQAGEARNLGITFFFSAENHSLLWAVVQIWAEQ